MNTNILFASAPSVVDSNLCNATAHRGSRRAFIKSFNNVIDVAVTPFMLKGGGSVDAYTFRSTNAVARAIAAGGFDVYLIAGDTFMALRNASWTNGQGKA